MNGSSSAQADAFVGHPLLERRGRPSLFSDVEKARGIVLAVSGGPDSTALMHLAALWRAEEARPPMWVAAVDHGLRPGSADVARRVMDAAGALGFDAHTLIWNGPKPERAIQERARDARYRLLFAFSEKVGASHLITGHTLDDQAETMLFRMARGSGLSGLAGMRSVNARTPIVLVRPLLAIRKSALIDACQRYGWFYEEDPANVDPAFARARWRRLTPALEAEGLTPERLGQLARRFARAEEALAGVAKTAERSSGLSGAESVRCFDAAALASHPEEIVLRVIAAALLAANIESRPRLNRLERLTAAILASQKAGRPLRRTLQGTILTLSVAGVLTIAPEGAHFRGRNPRTEASSHPVSNS